MVGNILEETGSKRKQYLCLGKVVRSSQPPPEPHLTQHGLSAAPSSSWHRGRVLLCACATPLGPRLEAAPFQGACPGFPATLPTSCLSPWGQQQPDAFFSALKLGAGATSSLLSLLAFGGAYSLQTSSARLSPVSSGSDPRHSGCGVGQGAGYCHPYGESAASI